MERSYEIAYNALKRLQNANDGTQGDAARFPLGTNDPEVYCLLEYLVPEGYARRDDTPSEDADPSGALYFILTWKGLRFITIYELIRQWMNPASAESATNLARILASL